MLGRSRWPDTNGSEAILLCYEQLSQTIYGKNGIYETQDCPFQGQALTLTEILDNFHDQHPMIKECWLSLFPVCVKHRQCFLCFQEQDDPQTKGMRSLRYRVIKSASELISCTYDDSIKIDSFIPPLVASFRALLAGCCIAVSIAKQWTTHQAHVGDLMKCTEIIALFASHWRGGQGYLQVWRSILDLLQKKLSLMAPGPIHAFA